MSYTLYNGDCLDILKGLADNSVQCCVTSPPYWQLRDYHIDGQIGLEPTLKAYIENLILIFREVRRVLKDNGTLWLNLGDSYASGGKIGTWRERENDFTSNLVGSKASQKVSNRNGCPVPNGLKPKDLMLIPHRVAIALQDDGWWVRMDNVWHKPNPMPESVNDRPTNCHEYVFLLSKSAKYFYDKEAVREPLSQSTHSRNNYSRISKSTSKRDLAESASAFQRDGRAEPVVSQEGRNLRSVWTITTRGFKGAHFATFPVDLAKRCILAGSSEGDTVLDPFVGSGTTALAALQLGRGCIGIELNPDYLTLAKNRIEQFINSRVANKTLEMF